MREDDVAREALIMRKALMIHRELMAMDPPLFLSALLTAVASLMELAPADWRDEAVAAFVKRCDQHTGKDN